MSTRALYTFKDEDGEYHVYKHCDGYPTGAMEAINATIKKKLAWELPRFEADEFAAGFIAANKTSGGSVRLTVGKTWQEAASCDIQYHYTITFGTKSLLVEVESVNAWGDDEVESTLLKKGTLTSVTAWAKKAEKESV